jgi:hypothetical protein
MNANATSYPGPRPARNRNAAELLEGVALVLILLTVGGFAGAASFTHVHDWTMDNSLPGVPDWFGWANAVVSELVPIAALLVMRRRVRTGQSVAYPAFLLGAALVFSVTAQLAVAKPGFSGGLVSVVPALAFAALAKLVLAKTTVSAGEPAVEAEPAAVDVPVSAAAVAELAAVRPEIYTRLPEPATPASRPADRSTWPTAPLPAALISSARDLAAVHLASHGMPIDREALQKALRVSSATAAEILHVLGTQRADNPMLSVNGDHNALARTA